jgi:hypothetical protein
VRVALEDTGMTLPCTPTRVRWSKPFVAPEETAADKQRNRRALTIRHM